MDDDYKNLLEIVALSKDEIELNDDNIHATLDLEDLKSLDKILDDYKRVQEEFKQIDHECSRLEEKETRLEIELEYYKDLIAALEIYYSITQSDLEECIKRDK